MLKIGCHLSISKGFYKAALETDYVGGNTFQYFSRNPQGFKCKDIDLEDLEKYKKFMREKGFYAPLVHAPYTLNCCSSNDSVRELAKQILIEDLERLKYFDKPLYNMHPGAHTGQGEKRGIELIIQTLNEVVKSDTNAIILLELMAGKGSDLGKTFEEIKEILDGLILKDKFGVCLDTCHVFAAGYDIVNDLDGVLDEFDRIIGLDKLKAIHLNDSLKEFKSYRDRHAAIGFGEIGKEALIKLVNNKRLKDIPLYLETPQSNLDGWKDEITMIKELYES